MKLYTFYEIRDEGSFSTPRDFLIDTRLQYLYMKNILKDKIIILDRRTYYELKNSNLDLQSLLIVPDSFKHLKGVEMFEELNKQLNFFDQDKFKEAFIIGSVDLLGAMFLNGLEEHLEGQYVLRYENKVKKDSYYERYLRKFEPLKRPGYVAKERKRFPTTLNSYTLYTYEKS